MQTDEFVLCAIRRKHWQMQQSATARMWGEHATTWTSVPRMPPRLSISSLQNGTPVRYPCSHHLPPSLPMFAGCSYHAPIPLMWVINHTVLEIFWYNIPRSSHDMGSHFTTALIRLPHPSSQCCHPYSLSGANLSARCAFPGAHASLRRPVGEAGSRAARADAGGYSEHQGPEG